jgi:hypothetical protein
MGSKDSKQKAIPSKTDSLNDFSHEKYHFLGNDDKTKKERGRKTINSN